MTLSVSQAKEFGEREHKQPRESHAGGESRDVKFCSNYQNPVQLYVKMTCASNLHFMPRTTMCIPSVKKKGSLDTSLAPKMWEEKMPVQNNTEKKNQKYPLKITSLVFIILHLLLLHTSASFQQKHDLLSLEFCISHTFSFQDLPVTLSILSTSIQSHFQSCSSSNYWAHIKNSDFYKHSWHYTSVTKLSNP